MTCLKGTVLGLSIAMLAACNRGNVDTGTAATTTTTTSVGSQQPALHLARGPAWPKAACSVISADAVAAVLHKPVTARPQDAITTCDYLTGGPDDISIKYWNHKGEFEIMKALLIKRHAKTTPVTGLGAEAMYGTYGTDAGLAVRLDDGRAFMVVGRERAAERTIAELVVAKQ